MNPEEDTEFAGLVSEAFRVIAVSLSYNLDELIVI
jgi:hypothetical protein